MAAGVSATGHGRQSSGGSLHCRRPTARTVHKGSCPCRQRHGPGRAPSGAQRHRRRQLQQGATHRCPIDELRRLGSGARRRRPLWSDRLQPGAANERARHSDGARRPTGPHPVARVARNSSGSGRGSRRRRGRCSCVDSLRVKPAVWSRRRQTLSFSSERRCCWSSSRWSRRCCPPGARRTSIR